MAKCSIKHGSCFHPEWFLAFPEGGRGTCEDSSISIPLDERALPHAQDWGVTRSVELGYSLCPRLSVMLGQNIPLHEVDLSRMVMRVDLEWYYSK